MVWWWWCDDGGCAAVARWWRGGGVAVAWWWRGAGVALAWWSAYIPFGLKAADEAWVVKEVEILRRASRAKRGADDDVNGAPSRLDAVEVEGGDDVRPRDLIGSHQTKED